MPTSINISASRGAAILGVSKWSTPVNIWLQIMESREPGFCERNKYQYPLFEESAAIRWGKAFESAIIELAESKQNARIINREEFFEKRKYNFLTCHIDGQYVFDPHHIPGFLHEGKTTSYFYWLENFGEPDTDRVPIEYQVQCQHQMICTGAEKVILSVLVFPRRVEDWEEMGWRITEATNLLFNMSYNKGIGINPFKWAENFDQQGYFHQYEIPADPALHERMIYNYTQWWEKYIIGKTEPEPQTYDDIKLLVREPVGTIIASEAELTLLDEYKTTNAELKTFNPRLDQIKTAVLNSWRKREIAAIDDDSEKKWIIRDGSGRKVANYGPDKNGTFRLNILKNN
jgi:YqaJ-like viral recombinase domain